VQLVSTKDQVLRNLRVFDEYRNSPQIRRQAFYKNRLRLGKQFVAGKIGNSYAFAPSRFVGYQDCTCERHMAFPAKDGKLTTPALTSLLGSAAEDSNAELQYRTLCASLEVEPANKARSYWMLNDSLPAAMLRTGDSGFPDELQEYVEGATKRVVVNAYERDSSARRACVAHYGCDCAVCGFNFLRVFGEVGRDFIHVHHLLPISTEKAAHAIDPIKDLRPVCPNCHAMLHQSDPPFSIEELVKVRKLALGADDT
jgi:5-methylcytosine-specific restriction enzyme A